MIPTDTTKKLEFTAKGLRDWSAAIGLHSLGFYGRMDPWDLISPKEQHDPSASTENLVAWRSEWVNDPKYADPAFKGSKAVLADLVAYLVSFTTAFDDFKTPQGSIRKSEVGVAMRQPIEGSNQMVLELDDDSPIRAMILDISGTGASDRENLLVENISSVIEAAITSA